jgi:uncharacterized protein YuzE
MKLEYDKEADALYFEFSTDDVAETKEVKEGVLIDFNARGDLCGIEVLHVSKRDWFNKRELEKYALKEG